MSSEPSPDNAAVVAQVRALHQSGVPVDEAIAALRAVSASPIDAIKSIRDVFGLPLGEAKHRVHQSPAWSDLRASIEQLHNDAEAALTDFNQNSE